MQLFITIKGFLYLSILVLYIQHVMSSHSNYLLSNKCRLLKSFNCYMEAISSFLKIKDNGITF
jgi:hypothetical protein